jgi:hypothetical protein
MTAPSVAAQSARVDLLAALANYPRLDQEYYDSLSPNISRSNVHFELAGDLRNVAT